MLSTYHKKTLFHSILLSGGVAPGVAPPNDAVLYTGVAPPNDAVLYTVLVAVRFVWFGGCVCGLGGLDVDAVVRCALRVLDFFIIIAHQRVCVNYNDVFVIFGSGGGNVWFCRVFSYNHL